MHDGGSQLRAFTAMVCDEPQFGQEGHVCVRLALFGFGKPRKLAGNCDSHNGVHN